MTMHHFWAQKVHLPQIRIFPENLIMSLVYFPCSFFFLKIITIILIYLLTLFFVQNLKKILPADPELWKMCNLWAHSGHLFPQIRIFSKNLLMSLISFIHAYLHAKYQSQILIY